MSVNSGEPVEERIRSSEAGAAAWAWAIAASDEANTAGERL
jgi:hypothetical protein